MPGGRKLFVNLSVRELTKSMEFFSKVGFEFDRRFTDDKAACMMVSGEAYVMLLSEPFFKTFTKREICDTATHTEGLFALSCATRGEVDEMVQSRRRCNEVARSAVPDHRSSARSRN
jgi:predicted lactoylglutathione lyase